MQEGQQARGKLSLYTFVTRESLKGTARSDGAVDAKAEAQRIWGNTKRFATADTEVATLFDLFDGMKASGYTGNRYRESYVHDTIPFRLVSRETLEPVLGHLQGIGKLDMEKRLFEMFIERRREEMARGSFGALPSEMLVSKDFVHNPELLVLLLGQYQPYYYHRGALVYTDRKEIVLGEPKVHLGKGWRVNERVLTEEVAHSSAFNLARELEHHFGSRARMYMLGEFLYVGDRRMYECGSVSASELRIRKLEQQRQWKGKSEKAIAAIEDAIAMHRDRMEKGASNYYPMLKVVSRTDTAMLKQQVRTA